MRKAPFAATAMLALPFLGALPASATDTGAVTQVTSGNDKSTVPIISGSGSLIAFHSEATNLPGAPQANPNIDDVFSHVVGGPGFTQFTNNARAVGPDLSSNGQWIVYTAGDGNVYRVPTGNPAGAVNITTSLPRQSGWQVNAAGARVADNGHVVFQSLGELPGATEDNQWDIFHWNGTTITKLSTGDAESYLNPDISADGSTVAYNSATVTLWAEGESPNHPAGDIKPETVVAGDVYVGPPTAGGAVNRTSAGNGRDELPKVSDNGAKVVFRSDSTNLPGAAGNGIANVHTWSSNGTFARVTNLPQPITNPAISGDGNFVAYQAAENGGQIFRSAAVANGTRIQLSANTHGAAFINYPALNTDGSKVVFAQTTGGATTPELVANVQVMLWSAPLPPVEVRCSFSDPILNAEYRAKTGNDARIARLYAGYFLRNPDAPGFAFWQTQIANGTWSNERAASHFGASDEFTALYGANLTNAQFVDRLYANVFCRQPDAGGRAFWLQKLDEGWSRGRVALSFTDLPEFRTRTQTPQEA